MWCRHEGADWLWQTEPSNALKWCCIPSFHSFFRWSASETYGATTGIGGTTFGGGGTNMSEKSAHRNQAMYMTGQG